MGAWRSIRHRLDDAARSSSSVAGVTYVGRSWRASPSEGYPTAHQLEQDRIVRAALGAPLRPDSACGERGAQRCFRDLRAVRRAAAATRGPWVRAALSNRRRWAGVSLRQRL